MKTLDRFVVTNFEELIAEVNATPNLTADYSENSDAEDSERVTPYDIRQVKNEKTSVRGFKRQMKEYALSMACSKLGVPIIRPKVEAKETPVWVRMDSPVTEMPVVEKTTMSWRCDDKVLLEKKRMMRFKQLLYTR